jgi:hypothetical protein
MLSPKSTAKLTFWAIIIAALVYSLSAGPARWTAARTRIPKNGRAIMAFIYWPVIRTAYAGPHWLRRPTAQWLNLGLPKPSPLAPIPE